MISGKKNNEKRFNDTLKRMLKTPPKPHDSDKAKKSQGEKKEPKPAKASASSSER